MNGCLTNGLRVESRKVQGYRRLFRKAEEHPLPVNRVREEEPFRDHGLVRDALSAVVNGRLQHVEISEPHGLLPVCAGRIEILDENPILAELVVEPALAEEGKRVPRAPNLLTGLLCAEDPIIASLDRTEAVNEIARDKAAESAVAVGIQE